MKAFTKALKANIRDTFTYSHARNKHQYSGKAELYDCFAFFENRLKEENPFKILMELDRVAFKRAKNIITRHEIPYTVAQEKQARVYNDITERMNAERSDVVAMYQEDLEGTGVVVYKEPYFLTTQETIDLKRKIDDLPRNKQSGNILYENKLDRKIANEAEQKKAVETCIKKQVSVLIGGAGTGKSFVTAEIIKQLQANRREVAVLAPTHKAKEALQEKVGSNPIVQTIHSFVHGSQECDTVVIDESGMLSTPLLLRLLERTEGKQLIFVGDKNQLPPIEYGRPFERLQEQFDVSELKKNRRSEANDIIALGREILGFPQNENMRQPNLEVAATPAEAFKKGAEVVLSFTNATINEVNEQQRIKGGLPSISPNFSVGDKIIATTNDSQRRFYNGQLFKITSPKRAINTKTGKPIFFKSHLELEYNFKLAYGLTIHKSQGSEWDTVAYQPSMYDTQSLAYVAVTRAKKKLIIIGGGIKSEYKPDPVWRQLV